MKIITAERPDPTNLTSCLDEEVPVLLPRLFGIAQLPFSTLLPSQIIFLEFFEVLFGCAEIFLQVSEGPDARPLSSPETEVRGDLSDENSKQVSSCTLMFPHLCCHTSNVASVFVFFSYDYLFL